MIIYFSLFYSNTYRGDLYIEKIEYESNKIIIRGSFLTSMVVFKGFTTKKDGEDLFITIKSGLATPKYNSGVFEFTIDHVNNVKNVFLVCKDKTEKISSRI